MRLYSIWDFVRVIRFLLTLQSWSFKFWITKIHQVAHLFDIGRYFYVICSLIQKCFCTDFAAGVDEKKYHNGNQNSSSEPKSWVSNWLVHVHNFYLKRLKEALWRGKHNTEMGGYRGILYCDKEERCLCELPSLTLSRHEVTYFSGRLRDIEFVWTRLCICWLFAGWE